MFPRTKMIFFFVEGIIAALNNGLLLIDYSDQETMRFAPQNYLLGPLRKQEDRPSRSTRCAQIFRPD